MPLPLPLSEICKPVVVPPQSLCVTMPGGAQLCVNLPVVVPPSASEVARAMFAQINAALAPLTPIFNLIDAIAAVVACVQAVPEAITKLDVFALVQCVPDMVEKVAKLMSLIPPLSIPVTIRDILTVIIAYLSGLVADLEDAKAQLQAIALANLKAQTPGNAGLFGAVLCAQGLYEAGMANMAAGAEPLNRLMGILNALLALVPGVDPLPCLGSLDALPTVVIDTLNAFIDILNIIKNILPGGLKLFPYTPKGANCT